MHRCGGHYYYGTGTEYRAGIQQLQATKHRFGQISCYGRIQLSGLEQVCRFLYSDSLASMYRIKVGAEVIPPRRDEVGKSLIPSSTGQDSIMEQAIWSLTDSS